MIEGVEILSERIVYVQEYCTLLIAVFTVIGFVLGIIICTVVWREFGFDAGTLKAAIGILCLSALIGVVVAVTIPYDTDVVDHIEYKVTIDDAVSMNDFLDKYKIIDQEGKIYTVRERTADGN